MAALAAKEITSDERARLEDMKKQAAELCAAGNTREGLDVAAEANAGNLAEISGMRLSCMR